MNWYQPQLSVLDCFISFINLARMFRSLHRLLMGYTRMRLIEIGKLCSAVHRVNQLIASLLTTYQQLHDSIHARSGQSTSLKLVYMRTDHEACLAWVRALPTSGNWLADHQAIRAVHERHTWPTQGGGSSCCKCGSEMGDIWGKQDIPQGSTGLLIILDIST